MAVPKLQFAEKVGPVRRWFAWKPVQTFDGCWVWLRVVARWRVQKHDHLPGTTDQWWVYAYPQDIRN